MTHGRIMHFFQGSHSCFPVNNVLRDTTIWLLGKPT